MWQPGFTCAAGAQFAYRCTMARNWSRPEPDIKQQVKFCDAPGCLAAGPYRAPKSRDNLMDYQWFCLDHVRDYNAKWDYCKGMSQTQLEDFIRTSTVGDRPSWPMGGSAAAYATQLRRRVLNDFAGIDIPEDDGPPVPGHNFTPAEVAALKTFELTVTADYTTIRKQYKKLAKAHHPDHHRGDKDAEEKLKQINQAYAVLKTAFAEEAGG